MKLSTKEIRNCQQNKFPKKSINTMTLNTNKYISLFCCKSWSATWQNVWTEHSAFLNEDCFIICFQWYHYAHSQLFNGFEVFTTPLVASRHQTLWNLSLNDFKKIFHSYNYDFKASIKKSNCFLYKW
jgi:hypothetical protein